MKSWIVMLVVGLLLVGGIVAVNALGSSSKTDYKTIPCSSCANGCTAESNCGNANCGALTGGECKCNSSGCGSCDGSCGSSGGCGQAGCSVTSGAKSCGCGK